MFLVRTFMLTRGTAVVVHVTDLVSADDDVLSIVRRHACRLHGSPTPETREAGERQREPVAAARARFRCEEGEIAERELSSFLPIVFPRCFASSRTIVPIRTAKSHAGSNAASCYCFVQCPLVKSWRFQSKISTEMSTFKAEVLLFLRETVARGCVYMTVVCTRVSMNDVDKEIRSSHFDHLNSYLYLRNFLCPRYRDMKRKDLTILSATSIATWKK